MLLRVAVGTACALATPVMAAEPGGRGYVHLGAGYVRQADDAALFAMGAPVPGAGFSTEGRITPVVEAGIFVLDGLAVALSAMAPTATPNIAAGTFAGMGNLGDETVGFYSLTGQYHLPIDDALTPYLGAGIGYMHVFDTTDGVVTDLNVASAVGGVVQFGVDMSVAEDIGVFADVKRYFISTTATGTMGTTSLTADARVDPWVVSAGISIGF